MCKRDVQQVLAKFTRLVLAVRSPRNVRATGVPVGERPPGFAVHNEVQAQGVGCACFHAPVTSIAALYSPRRAARLHWARCSRACWAAFTLASWPDHISMAGCWMARANENANAQGCRDLKRRFMAFNRAEASSPDWPPDKNAIPGTAAGTARNRHFTVASATSSTDSCLEPATPRRHMFAF